VARPRSARAVSAADRWQASAWQVWGVGIEPPEQKIGVARLPEGAPAGKILAEQHLARGHFPGLGCFRVDPMNERRHCLRSIGGATPRKIPPGRGSVHLGRMRRHSPTAFAAQLYACQTVFTPAIFARSRPARRGPVLAANQARSRNGRHIGAFAAASFAAYATVRSRRRT
jgi:hypothetical protein